MPNSPKQPWPLLLLFARSLTDFCRRRRSHSRRRQRTADADADVEVNSVVCPRW